MVGLYEGGNEPPGSLKASNLRNNAIEQGWAPGANPNSKRKRLRFIRHGINAVRCSTGKKRVEKKSYGSQ
ncbi:hypothetical protein ANN_02728 [Periplaneta americana]|uniref:Uncharacterized protein n=1 Tax=Periplaneta americana TaxID=6978 RepID=A0ABQ8TYT7_PERAM|nr:hypothetical protein ANN_02728 [Periplaneta americana]